jgi:hypothetical protein
MKNRNALLLISIISLASCLTLGETADEQNAPTEQEKAHGIKSPIRSVADLPSWVYDSSPRDGHPRSVIFTPLYSDEEVAFSAAMGMAAIDAARRDGIYVRSRSLTQEGAHNFGHIQDIDIQFLKENKAEYLDKLKLDDFIYTPRGAIARFSLPGSLVSPALDFTPYSGRPPEWITSPPPIEGYLATVGTAERHQDWGYSFEAADKSALANLTVSLYSHMTTIKTTAESYRNDSSQLASLETLFVSGEGILRDTMIIARWVDEKEERFYSLAVIPFTAE